jgi:hypothetical protein
MTEAGRLDMTLDWTFPASPMGLYLVPASTCSLAEFNARTCNFLVRSEPPGAKPRKASSTNLSAGNYRYLVANFGTNQESAALQLVLSKGTCPAVSSARPSVSGREDGELPLAVSRSIDWR